MNNLQYSNTAPINMEVSLQAANKMTTILLKSFFSITKGALMSTPTFNTTTNQVIVQVFYYLSPRLAHLSDSSINALSITISRLYPNINVELQLVQQHQPYINASILAQYLAINASQYGFHRMITLLLNAVPYLNPNTMQSFNSDKVLPSCTTGLKVQLSGLLTTQRNRARKTVYTASAGTFHTSALIKSQNAINVHIDYADSTSKSREGAFNIKVWISSTI